MITGIALFGPPLAAVGFFQYLSQRAPSSRSLLYIYGLLTVVVNAIMQVTPWADFSAEAVKASPLNPPTYCFVALALGFLIALILRVLFTKLSVKVEHDE